MNPPRVLPAVLLLATAASAQLPYLHSFGDSYVTRPVDVAVYGPGDTSKYVFVSDSIGVVRFPGEGLGNGTRVFNGGSLTGGIAVNDTPGHCREGEVYVGVRVSATEDRVYVLDTDGNQQFDFGILGGLSSIWGISCGLDGTVYVVDSIADTTYGFHASSMPAFSGSFTLVPDLTLIGPPQPVDVAVDQNNVVNVIHLDGSIARHPPSGSSTLCFTGSSGTPFGIDASDPCARVWVTKSLPDSVQSYLDCTPSIFATGTTLPRGVEFDKFQHPQFGFGSTSIECSERLYVVDYQFPPYEIDVYGEDHNSAPLPVGAVAWWRLDETQPCNGLAVPVRDVYGNVDGLALGGLDKPKTKEAMVGPGYQFGDPARVGVPDNSLLDFGTGDFTIEGWVLTTEAVAEQTILDKHSSGVGYSVGVSGGVLTLSIDDDVFNSQILSSGPGIADGKWHHFAFVVDHGNAEITGYVDGVDTSAPLTVTGSLDNAGTLWIGVDNTGVNDLQGRLDELTMYSRALLASEIAAIWSAHCAGKTVPHLMIKYCTAGTSGSGCKAEVFASGTPSATAASGFDLIATGVEGAKDGLFFFGSNGRQATPWGNSSSFQCIVPPVSRAGLLTGTGTSGMCDGAFTQDLNARWTAKPAQNPGVGAVVQAQLWYRDPFNTSNQTTSLSDAIEFQVNP